METGCRFDNTVISVSPISESVGITLVSPLLLDTKQPNR